MTVSTWQRPMRQLGVIGLLAALTACGSQSNTGPSDNNTTSNQSTVTLKLQGLTGTEQFMEVDSYVSTSGMTRDQAAQIKSQLNRCESSNQPVEVCTVDVPPNSIASFFAVEASDGVVEPLAGQTTIPSTPAGDVEFVSFTGCTVAQADSGGHCTLAPQAGSTSTVTATFSNMNTLAFDAEGAGVFTVTGVQARTQLTIPTQPNGITPGPGENSFIIGTNPAPQTVAFLPTGSSVTVMVAPTGQAKFINWTGCLVGGIGASCTLVEPTPGSAPSIATAFLQYWDCGTSNFADGPALPGCSLVSPSATRIRRLE